MCAKVKYATEQTAILRAGGYVHDPRNKKRKLHLRAYHCPECHFWHLTRRLRWNQPSL